MPYTPTVWVSGVAPPISAANLNHLETQYDQAIADRNVFATAVLGVAQTRQSTISLADVTGFSFTAAINTEYFFEAVMFYVATGSVTLGKWGMTVPGGASGQIEANFNDGGASDTDTIGNTVVEGGTTSERILTIRARITVAGTPGTVQLQWAQNVSDAEIHTIQPGSRMTVWEE